MAVNSTGATRGYLAVHVLVLAVTGSMVVTRGEVNTGLTIALVVSSVSVLATVLSLVRGPLPITFARPITLYGGPGAPEGVGAGGPSLVELFYSVFTFPAAVAHELAHAAVAVAVGGTITSVVVTLGGDAYLEYEPGDRTGRLEAELIEAAPVLLLLVVVPATYLALTSDGLVRMGAVYVGMTFLASSFPDQLYRIFD
jgi:hypothetical protein